MNSSAERAVATAPRRRSPARCPRPATGDARSSARFGMRHPRARYGATALELARRASSRRRRMAHDIHIIGGGLAGSEAAWQLGRRGFRVRLSRNARGRRHAPRRTRATGWPSWSARTASAPTTTRRTRSACCTTRCAALDSLIMRAGEVARVPAGSAMAVDRDVFSAEVERELAALPNVEIVRERIDALPAAGPDHRRHRPADRRRAGRQHRAAPPGRTASRSSMRSPRSSTATASTWTCAGWPRAGTRAARTTSTARWTREQYLAFVQGLLDGEKTEFREWEANTPYFEGCMPIEVMAERGVGDAALRADEAGRARQSALGDARASRTAAGPMRWSSCGRTTSSARCGTWSASRPS